MRAYGAYITPRPSIKYFQNTALCLETHLEDFTARVLHALGDTVHALRHALGAYFIEDRIYACTEDICCGLTEASELLVLVQQGLGIRLALYREDCSRCMLRQRRMGRSLWMAHFRACQHCVQVEGRKM